MKPAGIKEIARKAGVSTATVSDVLNGKAHLKRISAATEAKVRKIAKQMGYRPNLVAKSLVHRRSSAIGMMFQDISFPASDTIVREVFSVIETQGFDAFISVSQWDPDREQRQVNQFIDRQLDGIITVPLVQNRSFYNQLKTSFPVVQILDWLKGVKAPSVVLDGEAAMRDIVLHLYELGHRNIGYIGVKSDSMQLKSRYKSFLEISAELGLTLDRHMVEFGRNVDPQSVCDAGLKLLSQKKAPTAIVAVSDPVAVQLMEGLMGTRYDQKAAIAGIGDSLGRAAKLIGLTSVTEPHAEIGRIAGELIMKAISGEKLPTQPIFVKGQLKARSSTTGFRFPVRS